MLTMIRRLYARHPLATNSAAGWCLFGAGDLVSQAAPDVWIAESTPSTITIEGGRAGLDWERAAKVGVLGIVLNGFALHSWYRVLDRVFGKQLDSWRVVLAKVIDYRQNSGNRSMSFYACDPRLNCEKHRFLPIKLSMRPLPVVLFLCGRQCFR